MCFIFIGNPDECAVAAEIYQCGREAAPAMTNAIFADAKGNNTVVCPLLLFIIVRRRRTLRVKLRIKGQGSGFKTVLQKVIY